MHEQMNNIASMLRAQSRPGVTPSSFRLRLPKRNTEAVKDKYLLKVNLLRLLYIYFSFSTDI